MVRRLPRLRVYEILLLADLAAVVLLLRLRASLGLDVVHTLLDTKDFVSYTAPFLLGGIVLRVGNSILDASIRNRLDQLRREVAKAT